MLRGIDDKGAVFIGLLRGPLLDRLLAGERVFLEKHVDGNGLEHPGLWLDFSGGPRKVQALVAGERVCVPRVVDETGREVHPHVCLFVRDTNEGLEAALKEYFPDGFVPGAAIEHVSKDEPKGGG